LPNLPLPNFPVAQFSVAHFTAPPNYFLAQRHQTAAKHSNLWHSDLKNNGESGYDCLPPHLCNAHTCKTFQASYILVTNQTVKLKKMTNAEIYSALI